MAKRKQQYITERPGKKCNSFEICIRMNGQSFRKRIKQSDFNSRTEALDFACKLRDEKLVEMRNGYTAQIAKQNTVKHLYDRSFELLPLSIKTRKKHDFVFKAVIEKYGETKIDDIKPADILMTLNEYGRTHSAKDTSRVLSIWRRIYATCSLEGINIADKTVGLKIPKCAKLPQRKKDISSSDLEIFLDELLSYNSDSITGAYRCRSIYYGIRIMQYCGLRPSECFALKKDDIHLKQGYISINKAVRSSQDELITIGETKTRRSIRTVPIPSDLKPILQDCLNWARHDILLSDYYGNLLDIDDIGTLIRNVRKHVNIEFNLYMLRHQFSTDLMTQGTPPNVIRDLMGHESASMTLDYATTRTEDLRNAINARKFS